MVLIDCGCSETCSNPDAYNTDTICVKCGRCGRKFDENGTCINIAEYPTDTFDDE